MSIKINPDQSTVALLRRSVVKRERIPEQTEKAKVAVKPKESIREIIAEKVEQAVSKHREKSAETLKESLAELKEAFTLFNTAIKFDKDELIDGELIIKVVKKDSGEVVYQIPPEYVIAFRRMAELFPGFYLDRSA